MKLADNQKNYKIVFIFNYTRLSISKGVQSGGVKFRATSFSTQTVTQYVFMELTFCTGALSCWNKFRPLGFIHSSTLAPILHRVPGNLIISPGDSGHKVEDTLDRLPTNHRVRSRTLWRVKRHQSAETSLD